MHVPSSHLGQRSNLRSSVGHCSTTTGESVSGGSGSSGIPSLTQANLARINNANAQECHQGKMVLQQSLKKVQLNPTHNHHQTPETVADASYYSSVLNSFGAVTNSGKIYDESMPQNHPPPSSWQQQQQQSQQQQPPPPPPPSYYR